MFLRFILVAVLAGYGLWAAPLAPEQDQKLALEIYKQLVEIKSGYTTGSTTLVAEAAAAHLRAAGFPASDIFVGGAAPNKHNLVVRLSRDWGAQADSAAGT